MDATIWQIISIIGFSLAGVFILISVLLFFTTNIPAIVGDLSGKTARKQIEEIREHNSLTGEKRHKPNMFNLERGELTKKINVRTGKIGKTEYTNIHPSKKLNVTVKMGVGESSETEVLNLTEVLGTEVLGTEVLSQDNQTTVLNSTTVLSQKTEFKIIKNEIIIHTDNLI